MRRPAAQLIVLAAVLAAPSAPTAAPPRAASTSARGGTAKAPAPPAAVPLPPPPAPAPSVTPAPAKSRRTKVAVMDIRALDGVSESATKVITELIATEIQALGRYDVISRADVANMLGFQREKEMLGCTEDAACMAEIGGALGTDYVLVGQVAAFGSRYRIAISLQDVKKAKVVSRQGSFCDRNEDALAAATQEAVGNIFREVDAGGQLPPPIVKKTPAPVPAVAPPATPLRKAGWITAGAGLAVLAAGGVFDYLGYAAYKDEQAAADAGDVAALEEHKATSLDRRQTAKLLYAGGALAVGTGVVLHFVGAPKGGAVSLDVRPLPGGALATLSGSLP